MSLEDEVKIVRWYTGDTRSGRCYSLRWIAAKLDIGKTTVQRILERHEIESRGKGRPPARTDGLRRCAICSEVYKLSRFAPDASKPQGRSYYCRGCNSTRHNTVYRGMEVHGDDD